MNSIPHVSFGVVYYIALEKLAIFILKPDPLMMNSLTSDVALHGSGRISFPGALPQAFALCAVAHRYKILCLTHKSLNQFSVSALQLTLAISFRPPYKKKTGHRNSSLLLINSSGLKVKSFSLRVVA